MAAEYGFPYMGSKGSIAVEILSYLPKAENFYDLFAGGFAITHCAAFRFKKKWNSIYANDLQKMNVDLFNKAVAGDFSYDKFKPHFVTREEFNAKKDTDAYIKYCWSFSNNGKGYLFSKEIEGYKKEAHNFIIFNDTTDKTKELFGFDKFPDGLSVFQKRIYFRRMITYKYNNLKPSDLRRLQQLQQLERLEQLQRLEQLERLGKITTTSLSYDKVPIKENSIIYCDPPYENTSDYGIGFNKKKFLDWACDQNQQVYISEFNILDPRFECVLEIEKRSLMNGANTKSHKPERLYRKRNLNA